MEDREQEWRGREGGRCEREGEILGFLSLPSFLFVFIYFLKM